MNSISVYNYILPNKSLSNYDLDDAINRLDISNFRGVYCRDELPKLSYRSECGILNLDDSSGDGTHWVCWFKNGNFKCYFDSYGIQPPTELVQYLKSPIYYNSDRIQPNNTVICGHLCLYVLKSLSVINNPSIDDFLNIVNTLN